MLTKSTAAEIEAQFRTEFRGARCEIYESSRSLQQNKREAVISDHLAGRSFAEIKRTHDVSRATLCRYLKTLNGLPRRLPENSSCIQKK